LLLLSSTKIQSPSIVGGTRRGPFVMSSGLPPLRTTPVEALIAHNAPPVLPGGAQQINGLRTAAPVRTDVLCVVALQTVPVHAHVVPIKTMPPALAAGTERGTPGEVSDPGAYESGPNAVCHAIDGVPQPGLIAIMPGWNIVLLLEDTPTYNRPVTGE
jgi:hypothetical protein